jgi:primosomal protein N' (replication factor Y)
MCPECDVSLVLHRAQDLLACHHCGHREPVPETCPACRSVSVARHGAGTERLEHELAGAGLDVFRLDADVARPAQVLARFEAAPRGVLVGTQMVAKGHDFRNLTLVGVLNPDTALYSHDYRAGERLFAQLMQVAGRAGRTAQAEGGSPSEVLVQTRYPEHPLYGALVNHDYDRFAGALLAERAQAGLPPYLFQAMLRAEAAELAKALEFLQAARDCVLGDPVAQGITINDPIPMSMTRVYNVDRAQLLVESPSRPALQGFLKEWMARLRDMKSRVKWSLEVDPVDI